MSVTPEGKIKREINKLLDKYGCYRFMPVPTRFGKKTIDYLVCAGGYFLGVEAKAPGKEPTGLQEITLEQIHQAGGMIIVVDGPVSLQALERMLYALTSTRVRETQSLGRAA